MFRRRPYWRYRVRSPWQEVDRLQQEMNRLFSTLSEGDALRPAGYPAMNVWTNPEGAVVTAELPGFDSEDIDISVVGDQLTLSGSRQPEELGEGERYHRRERRFGQFTRTFQLPFQVEANNVEARYEKGILYIELPRAEVDKPKRITVKAAA